MITFLAADHKAKTHKIKQLIKLSLIIALPYVSSSSYANQDTQIKIVQNSQALHYSSPARLSRVLTDAQLTLDYQPYSLGASLVDNEKQNALDIFKENILEALTNYRTFSTEKILSQLKSSTFSPREKVSLDNDIARVFPKANPLLNGRFTLSLPKRPNSISVYGAIQSDSELKLNVLPTPSLKNYLPELPLYNVAMKFPIWIIQPDQTTHYVANIRQEAQPLYLAPGAIIYIGSNEIPKQLNKDIVKLLQNRLEK